MKKTNKQRRLVDEAIDHGLMSLTAANMELQKVRLEHSILDQKLSDLASRYEHDKLVWVAALNQLLHSITVLKEDHCKLAPLARDLALEAHQCGEMAVSSMLSATQALVVAPYEDLKLKYNQEQAKLRELHNELLNLKGSIRVFVRCRPLNE